MGSKCQGGQCIVPKVDILFLLNNALAYQKQSALYAHTSTFLQALQERSIQDFQIAVATTNMDKTFNPNGWGRLLQADPNTPKIISSQLPPQQITDAFAKNIRAAFANSLFTRPLEALQALLSPSQANGFGDSVNKGFLRTGATLAIFLFTDKDDCSHEDKLDERYPPNTCTFPPNVTINDDQGNPILGSNGQPLKGQMDKLTPVLKYLDFMRSLGRDLVVFGVFGDPFALQPGTTHPIDPKSGCTQHTQCGTQGAICSYQSHNPITRKCGGCKTNDEQAGAAFRLFEFISKANLGDPNEYWSPICGNEESVGKAIRQFAKKIALKLGI